MSKHPLLIALLALLTATASLSTHAEAPGFKEAYGDDHLWPAWIVPQKAINGESGQTVLEANIPVVLIRAYEDGYLSVVDRSGNLLIDHSATDFLEQIASLRAEQYEGNTKILLHQLGRRLYDRTYHDSKAVSETELANYSKFLLVRTPNQGEALDSVLESLNQLAYEFDREGIRPILAFDELLHNQVFYERVKEKEINYPVIVPVFQKGFIQALFTKREEADRCLLLNINGKLLGAYPDLTSFKESL